MNDNPCDDYKCEGEKDHTHVGVQPHLRRVMAHGELIDGLTGDRVITDARLVAISMNDPEEGQG